MFLIRRDYVYSPLQEVEYIFNYIIYFHMCHALFCRIYSTFLEAESIFFFSFFFSLASDRANRMREVSFTRPYIVGRKRDGERDIKVSRNLVPS